MPYIATIIREDLRDQDVLDEFTLLSEFVSERDGARWHTLNVVIPREKLEFALWTIQRTLKPGRDTVTFSNEHERLEISPAAITRTRESEALAQPAVAFAV